MTNKEYMRIYVFNRNHRLHPNMGYGNDGRREAKLGERNPMWKGDKAGLQAIHTWIIQYKPKPDLCEECHQQPPRDCANISGKYLRDVNDYRWLCRRCHMKSDGRMKNLTHNHPLIS